MPATTLRLLKSALAPCSCRVGRAGPHHTARPRQGTCSEGQAPLELRGRGVCHATWIRATRDGSEGHTLADMLLFLLWVVYWSAPGLRYKLFNTKTTINIDLSVIMFSCVMINIDVCVSRGSSPKSRATSRERRCRPFKSSTEALKTDSTFVHCYELSVYLVIDSYAAYHGT